MNYPDSQLAEERELLSVEAELAAGNVGEARFRAEEFQRRFPHSLLLPRVQAALARLH
jgi:outer membrane protein assembly factor BamD (BamD/ComL family)